jgi:hypothetical protein
MSLNESIVEDAALEWIGDLGYTVGHGPHLAPGEAIVFYNRWKDGPDDINVESIVDRWRKQQR